MEKTLKINQKIIKYKLKNFKKINKINEIKFKNINKIKIKIINLIINIPTILLWTIIVHIVIVVLI